MFTFTTGAVATNTEVDFCNHPVLANPNIVLLGLSSTVTASSTTFNSGNVQVGADATNTVSNFCGFGTRPEPPTDLTTVVH